MPAAASTPLGSAFQIGGPRCVTRAVQQLSGIAITGFLGVDPERLGAAADALGGVAVCVPRPVDDAVLGSVVARPGRDDPGRPAGHRLRPRRRVPVTRVPAGPASSASSCCWPARCRRRSRGRLCSTWPSWTGCARRSARPCSPTASISTGSWRSAGRCGTWKPTGSPSPPCRPPATRPVRWRCATSTRPRCSPRCAPTARCPPGSAADGAPRAPPQLRRRRAQRHRTERAGRAGRRDARLASASASARWAPPSRSPSRP